MFLRSLSLLPVHSRTSPHSQSDRASNSSLPTSLSTCAQMHFHRIGSTGPFMKAAAFVVCVLPLTSTVAFGAAGFTRLNIRPYADGKYIEDAEVCIFAGRNADDFTDQFLTGHTVVCQSAANPVELAPGFWNYYVQRDRTWVSSHPHGINIGKEATGDARPMRVDLLPAASLDLTEITKTLHFDERLAVYLANEGQRSRPAIRPVPAGAPHVLVPADMHVQALVVRDETIVWAASPVVLKKGEVARVLRAPHPTKDVIAIVSLSPTTSVTDRIAMDGA